MESREFLPLKGNYRELIAFQKTECIYDITYYFSHTFLEQGGIREQMTRARLANRKL